MFKKDTMTKNLLYLFLLGSIFLSSCETEIDTIAEYKDITVVYGLLNPNDTTHYVRITKAFSGEGNAYDLASNANNFYYADGELSVTIDEYDASDIFKRSFSLTRVDVSGVIPKDDGTFDNSQNVLYKFTEPNLKQDYTYKLKIVNSKLGKEITSETKLANNPSLSNLSQMGKIKVANSNGSSLTHTFSIQPSLNSGRVKLYFIFNYTEHYTDTNITPIQKHVRISLGEQKTTSNDGGEILSFSLEGKDFFDALKGNIPVTVPNLKSRSISNGMLEVIAAGTALSTYIAVNEPSTSVNQNKPEFTNLTNGLGVFSSRTTKLLYTPSLAFSLTNPTIENSFGFDTDGQVNYDDNTLKALLTLGLEFCNPRNNNPSLPFAPPAPRCEDIVTNWSSINPE